MCGVAFRRRSEDFATVDIVLSNHQQTSQHTQCERLPHQKQMHDAAADWNVGISEKHILITYTARTYSLPHRRHICSAQNTQMNTHTLLNSWIIISIALCFGRRLGQVFECVRSSIFKIKSAHRRRRSQHQRTHTHTHRHERLENPHANHRLVNGVHSH